MVESDYLFNVTEYIFLRLCGTRKTIIVFDFHFRELREGAGVKRFKVHVLTITFKTLVCFLAPQIYGMI